MKNKIKLLLLIISAASLISSCSKTAVATSYNGNAIAFTDTDKLNGCYIQGLVKARIVNISEDNKFIQYSHNYLPCYHYAYLSITTDFPLEKDHEYFFDIDGSNIVSIKKLR